MIQDRKATGIRATAGEIVIAFEGEAGTTGARRVSLLLDASGHLVGVDLGGDAFARTAVMLGPHEAVASQREANAVVGAGELRLPSGAVPLPNPYV